MSSTQLQEERTVAHDEEVRMAWYAKVLKLTTQLQMQLSPHISSKYSGVYDLRAEYNCLKTFRERQT